MGIKTFLVLAGLLIIVGVSYVWLDVIQNLNTGGLHAVANAPTSQSDTSTTSIVIASSSAPLSARVIVSTPIPNATTSQAFTVAGLAPGSWFFEASFPIQVRDSSGNIVGTSVGKAQGEWMTSNLVPFNASVTVTKNFQGKADLILLRDNPSGLPENDDSVVVPIIVE